MCVLCVVEQWLSVHLMCCGAVARCTSYVLWSSGYVCVLCVMEQWLGVCLMCCGAVARCVSYVLWSSG